METVRNMHPRVCQCRVVHGPYLYMNTNLLAARTTSEDRKPINRADHGSTVAHAGVIATKPGSAKEGVLASVSA